MNANDLRTSVEVFYDTCSENVLLQRRLGGFGSELSGFARSTG